MGKRITVLVMMAFTFAARAEEPQHAPNPEPPVLDWKIKAAVASPILGDSGISATSSSKTVEGAIRHKNLFLNTSIQQVMLYQNAAASAQGYLDATKKPELKEMYAKQATEYKQRVLDAHFDQEKVKAQLVELQRVLELKKQQESAAK